MKLDDTVDRTIRNQRPPTWVRHIPFAALAIHWTAAGTAIEYFDPSGTQAWIVPCLALACLLAFFVLLQFTTDGSVSRMKLGEEVFVGSNRRIPIKDIREIRFADDPCEDYSERELPIRLCQVVVLASRRTEYSMILSQGDASRFREWAEAFSIPVNDPFGHSSRKPEHIPPRD